MAIADQLAPLPSMPFSVAIPEGDVAMDDHWRRLGNRVRASQAAAPAGYPDPQGLLGLREAIAGYLRRARAVRCGPENIVITEGTQQGIYLAVKVLLTSGDAVWAEDPAYPGLTSVLEDSDVRVHRIPVMPRDWTLRWLSGLMLGFGGFTAEQLRSAVQRLRLVLDESANRAG